MTADVLGEISQWILGIFIVVVYLLLIVRLIWNKCMPVRTAEATVIDKQKFARPIYSKVYMGGSREKYVVTFMAEGKKLMFYVSEFSYDGYELNEKGILEYKGNQIVDFYNE